ncbi:MAG: YfiR family protein [Bacteroidota bacterium]
MRNFKTKLLLTALTLGVLVNTSFSQERPMHEIHSMMVYNFIKYIQWPDNSSKEFVIGVLGEDDVYKTLTTWYNGKLKGSQKLTIKKYDKVSDMQDCHVLYISNQSSRHFADIQAKVDQSKTLIITDKPGLGQKGSAINFKKVNNRLAFELNQSVIEASSLKVSRQLSGIAILI